MLSVPLEGFILRGILNMNTDLFYPFTNLMKHDHSFSHVNPHEASSSIYVFEVRNAQKCLSSRG